MKFSLEIVAHDDKVTISYPGEHTVIIRKSSDGAVFSPAWNDRHFTLATDADTDVPYSHVTDETSGDQLAKMEYRTKDEYLYDICAGMGSFGTLKPANYVNADYLWVVDNEGFATVLEEEGVIELSETRVWMGFDRLADYLERVAAHEDELAQFLDRVYDPVDLPDAWDCDSPLLFTPRFESVVLQRYDGYVMEMSVENPFDVFNEARSARFLDVMWQMFEDPVITRS